MHIHGIAIIIQWCFDGIAMYSNIIQIVPIISMAF
jgi:hypothetical protein